jgi:hypothetical protein
VEEETGKVSVGYSKRRPVEFEIIIFAEFFICWMSEVNWRAGGERRGMSERSEVREDRVRDERERGITNNEVLLQTLSVSHCLRRGVGLGRGVEMKLSPLNGNQICIRHLLNSLVSDETTRGIERRRKERRRLERREGDDLSEDGHIYRRAQCQILNNLPSCCFAAKVSREWVLWRGGGSSVDIAIWSLEQIAEIEVNDRSIDW